MSDTKKTLCIYKNKPKYTIQICSLIPDLKEGEFGNATLAKALCKLGFDGYYMPGKYSDAREVEVNFHEEYFICDPENLENIGEV